MNMLHLIAIPTYIPMDIVFPEGKMAYLESANMAKKALNMLSNMQNNFGKFIKIIKNL